MLKVYQSNIKILFTNKFFYKMKNLTLKVLPPSLLHHMSNYINLLSSFSNVSIVSYTFLYFEQPFGSFMVTNNSKFLATEQKKYPISNFDLERFSHNTNCLYFMLNKIKLFSFARACIIHVLHCSDLEYLLSL